MIDEGTSVGEIRDVYGVAHFEWDIRNYSLLTKERFSLTSPSFEIFSDTWNLALYPAILRKDSRANAKYKRFVSIFLEKKCSKVEDLCVFYKLDLKVHGKVLKSFSESFNFKGFCRRGEKDFLHHSRIPELQPEDTVTVLLYIYPTTPDTKKEPPSDSIDMSVGGLNTLITNMEDLYLKQQDCDFKIRVKTREFGVHKAIIAARSPVFNAMLHHDMKEKNTGIVQIEDFEPDIFNDFLLYLYTGRKNCLSWRNVTELYSLGDMYGLQCLKKECVKYMMIHLSIDKFCEILEFAVKYEESTLLEDVDNFFVKNVHLIYKTNQWQEFMVKNLPTSNNPVMKYFFSKS